MIFSQIQNGRCVVHHSRILFKMFGLLEPIYLFFFLARRSASEVPEGSAEPVHKPRTVPQTRAFH